METAESVSIMSDRLKDQISKIKCQLERLDDITLSLNDSEVEANLRGVSAYIRRSVELMSEEFEPKDTWLAH